MKFNLGIQAVQHVTTTVQAHPVLLVADVTAVSVAAATVMGYLPSIAALLSVIWLSLQIILLLHNWPKNPRHKTKR